MATAIPSPNVDSGLIALRSRYLDDKTNATSSMETATLIANDCSTNDSNIHRRDIAKRRQFLTTCCSTTTDDRITGLNKWSGSAMELDGDFKICKSVEQAQLYRIINKNGYENVSFKRIPEKSLHYIRDFVTTLIELKWKYMLAMFVASYFISWLVFATLCYIVTYLHGDLIFNKVTKERLGEGSQPCIVGVYDFTSMLIYSIETQTTIGFGEKYPSEECPLTVLIFILQIVSSIAIEGGMISIIYAKTARPVRQITKMKFSDKAVICYRDGKLCLLFRVCDPREQQAIKSKIRLYMIMDKATREGEIIKTPIELQLENSGEQIINWPEIICHVIDSNSPLVEYKNAETLHAGQFELYVSIVGVSPTTAQVTEARTSYMPREIFWGHRFLNIIRYDAVNERYVYNYSNFNTTMSVAMNEEPAN